MIPPGLLPSNRAVALSLCALLLIAGSRVDARAQAPGRGEKWAAAWVASPHGPYPSGNASAQPDLSLALPGAAAHDQTFRMMVKPDRWGRVIRIRLTNVFGTAPLMVDGMFVGLQASGGRVAVGTNRPVAFKGGAAGVTIPAGESLFSDPVALPFVGTGDDPQLAGRRLAISFHVVGDSGRMTWHAKALTTGYLSAPGAGSHGEETSDLALPFTTTSWFFVDAVDVVAPVSTVVIACLGDSITDGTASTLNGDDRWPDVFAARMHAVYGSRVSVVNAGIGGNRVVGPAIYTAASPVSGGPSALDRLDRDVFGISGLSAVMWLEGINDIAAGTTADAIEAGLEQGVARLRAHGVGMVVAATITPTLGNGGAHGTPAADQTRRRINAFLSESRLFDFVVDFAAATIDPATGGLRQAFQPNSTTGGAGDKLHPNRAGYQAMGAAIDPALFAPLFQPAAR
jgi:lysophospholipase L1-like esterase